MAATRQAGEELQQRSCRINIKNDGLLSLQRKQQLQGRELQIAEILKPIPLPPPPPAPAVSEQEEEVEGEDEEIMEGIEDELFEVHSHDLEEEVAARMMMQDEIDRGDIYGIGSDGDFGNESGLLQDLDFD
ncbi:hypothetical protein BDD12DRAFT_807338 [Trichophaea hybrida]|nr:hypothetical protein BDD12DRAFT_807338 [Trichophaea hybrida]